MNKPPPFANGRQRLFTYREMYGFSLDAIHQMCERNISSGAFHPTPRHKKTRQVGEPGSLFFGGQMVLGRPVEHISTWPVGVQNVVGDNDVRPGELRGRRVSLSVLRSTRKTMTANCGMKPCQLGQFRGELRQLEQNLNLYRSTLKTQKKRAGLPAPILGSNGLGETCQLLAAIGSRTGGRKRAAGYD